MRRGEIYHLTANPRARGHEQRGPRRAVVVQASRLEALSTTLIVPTTTGGFEGAWRVPVEFDDGVSFAMCDQLTACDPAQRLGAFIGFASFEELEAIDRALRLVLDL